MDPVPRAITSATIKIVIWVIPVILLVKIIEKKEWFSYLGLRHNFRKGLKWIGWVAFVLIVLYLTVFNKTIDFRLEFHEWLNMILLVGITEEIVFRGFLLRKLMDSFRFWMANTITSFLFVSIHFPIWMFTGYFEYPSILIVTIISIFVFSIFFGFVYKKTGSLWSVIIIHSLYNMIVLLFN